MDSVYLSPIIGLSLSEHIEGIQPLVKRKAPSNPRFNIKEIHNRFINGLYDHTLIIYKDSDGKGNVFETNDFTQSFREDLQQIVMTRADEYKAWIYPKYKYIPVYNTMVDPDSKQEFTHFEKPKTPSVRVKQYEEYKDKLETDLIIDKPLRKASISYYIANFHEHTDCKIRFHQRINRPVNHCFGKDCSGHPTDPNSYKLGIDEKSILNTVRKLNHKTEPSSKLVTDLYNSVLCLFIINMSWDLTWEDLDLNNVMYIFLLLMNMVLKDEGDLNWINCNMTYITGQFRKRLSDSLSYGFEHEIDKLANKCGFILPNNQCRFPKGWTAEQKKRWKEENNIVRKPYKERKEITEKRESVIQMKKDRVKVKDICKLNHISLSTYYKIISNIQ